MNKELKHFKAEILPEARKLLLDRKPGSSFRIDEPLKDGEDRIRRVSIRASKKMIWFIAYRLKEITGKRFDMENGLPDYLPVGKWPDGSGVVARVSENKHDGPYWIEFSLELNVERNH